MQHARVEIKMNKNETRTLWISVGAALFAVFLLYSYTQEKSAELTSKFGAMKKVVVAKADIHEMQTIDETMLEVVERPVDFVQPNALIDREHAVAQVALAPINKGEQILPNKIRKPDPVTGLALQISPGKRAVTLPVDDVRGVARLIKPGDRIDIIAAVDVGSGLNKKKQVKTIMQDVAILATGVRITNELPRLHEVAGKDEYKVTNIKGNTKFNNITVEVEPKDSQKLIYILATAPGSLFFTLRHPSDRLSKPISTAGLDSVLGRPSRSTFQKRFNTRKPAKVSAPKPTPKPVKRRKKKQSGPFVDI